MTLIGSTMTGEQAGPRQPVRDVALAEQADFDSAVISDHYFRGCKPGATPLRVQCPARPPQATE